MSTTKTHFRHPNGDIYLHVVDAGVSMGSLLGPLMARFYISLIENADLDDMKPTIHCRYVDDIFVIVPSLGQID